MVTFRAASDETRNSAEVRLGDSEADLVGALLELPDRDAMSGSLGAEELRSRIRRLLWPARRTWLRDVAREHLASSGVTILEGALTTLAALCDQLLARTGPRARIAYSPDRPVAVDWSAFGRVPDDRPTRVLRHGSCGSRFEIPKGEDA